MIVMGLTGSLGAGKSTVLKIFEDFGAEVVDTDKIARELLGLKGRCVNEVKKLFPEAYAHGVIQRGVLADIVFEKPKRLKALENILHPRVRREVLQKLKVLKKKRSLRMIVVDVPLLFEAGFDDLFDAVTVVRTNQTLQFQRLRKDRGMTRRDMLRRVRHQMPQVEKMKKADFIIDNRSTKAKTRAQVKRIWEGLVSV